jgi:hypothetical protein
MSILKGSRDLISALPLRDLKGMPPSIELPANFAKIHTPRWTGVGEEADWGIVIGKFYNCEPRRYCWMWCYIIWLAANSKSAAGVSV